MLVDGTLDNLLQGVSQQPNRDRLPGQCTAQENAIADIVDGWKRRPPTQVIATLFGKPDSETQGLANPEGKWHFYDRGNEQFIIHIVRSNTTDVTPEILVFDLDGNQYTVDNAGGTYTDCSNTDFLHLHTIGDYTIVVNEEVPPLMSSTVRPQQLGAVFNFTVAGENEQRFTITDPLGAVRADWTGPALTDTGVPEGAFSLKYAIEQLYDQLVADSLVNGLYNIYKSTNALALVRKGTSTAPVNFTISDGHAASTTCWVVEGVVEKVERLPNVALDGMIVGITGAGTNDKDDYYMQFTVKEGSANSDFGTEGVWREISKPDEIYQWDSDTMPHALVRTPYGTHDFWFGPLDGGTHGSVEVESWEPRNAGSEVSNPVPSFANTRITGVGTFQERLYLTQGDVINFSSTEGYFDFFNKTATTLLDTDPVELPLSGSRVTPIRYVVPHNKNLVLFTDFSQHVIKGSIALSPKTAHMQQTTDFESSGTASPVSTGGTILFPINYGEYAGVQEFFTESTIEQNNARAITEHVKRYIRGDVAQMASNITQGIVCLRSDYRFTSIYIYQYLWQNNERVQSAWSEWKFNMPIKYMFWKGSDLYFVFRIGDNTVLTKIDMTDAPPDSSFDYNLYMDFREDLLPDINWSVAHTLDNTFAADQMVAVAQEPSPYAGLSVPIDRYESGRWYFSIDPLGPVYMGVKFNSLYSPSMPKILDYKDRVMSSDRLTLTRFNLRYKNSGYFKCTVKHPYYTDTVQEFTGRVLGEANNLLGTKPVTTGIFPASIRRNVQETEFVVETDDYTPLTLTDIEWIGQYNKRGRRV